MCLIVSVSRAYPYVREMGRFPTLVGRLPDFVVRRRFQLIGKQPIKKRGIKRLLIRE